MSPFNVKQERFEGPLDLLLSLIERRQLHISDIALVKVTDDFASYVKGLTDFPVAESAQFVLIAATLLLIKSKALLPALTLTPEETQSVEELERRLKLLKRFRGLARKLRPLLGTAPLFLPRERPIEPVFAPPRGLSQELLLKVLKDVLAALPRAQALAKATVAKVVSLEEMIDRLSERIKEALRMNFSEFSRTHKEKRVEVIVGFLALLELFKQGLIAVTQERAFGEIVMETNRIEIPRY